MCPCAYCQRMMNSPMPGCRCEMCQRGAERASINRNLGALAMIGGDVRGYGAFAPPAHPVDLGVRPVHGGAIDDPRTRARALAMHAARPVLSSYGQRSGGCGCNGSR